MIRMLHRVDCSTGRVNTASADLREALPERTAVLRRVASEDDGNYSFCFSVRYAALNIPPTAFMVLISSSYPA